MSNYCFRFLFIICPKKRIGIDSNSLKIQVEDSKTIILGSQDNKFSIRDSKYIVLKGSGWTTEEDAKLAGQKYQEALILSLARLRIGIDFGSRVIGRSFVSNDFLNLLQQESGERVMNDRLGLQVYECNHSVKFITMCTQGFLTIPQQSFEKVFNIVFKHLSEISKKEELALQLFHIYFFQESIDAKFLLLVTAIEALIEFHPRSDEAVNHVNQLIELTTNSNSLQQTEKDSLIGSLRFLRQQSISQAGSELADTRLSGRKYKDFSPSKFFKKCYDIRSRLIHGTIPQPPVFGEVGEYIGVLEEFVSDLLCAHFLEELEKLVIE